MKVLFLSHRKNHSAPIYWTNLFFSFHYAATLYVSSSYLENYFSSIQISIFFILGAVGNIILFLLSPRLLKSLGNRKLLFFLLALETISTLGLALNPSALMAGGLFIVRGSIIMLIYYCLDIFLEEITDDKKTGGVRGLYLTVTNTAIALSPLLVAYFAIDNNYSLLYLVSALILVPTILLALFSFHDRDVSKKHTVEKKVSIKAFWKNNNIRHVTISTWVLEMFFVFMVIYMPLYLHQIINFEWKDIGIMFSIMLLPFVIFDWPVGILADKKYGEKEIMTLGFFIMGVSLLFMPFIGKNIIFWTTVLFISRIGASFIETTSESYFFKHVDARDIGLISFYRLCRPGAVVIGTALSAVSIYLFSFGPTFFIISILVFYGLKQTLYLKDTR
jgi:MFS family permease